MCGIFGIVSLNNRFDIDELYQANACLNHRGPNDSGVWHEGEVGLAHTRLSIHDLSFAGKQPMFSYDKRYCIVFNGEIYNYKSIRNELQSSGIHCKSDSDTEVLINAIACWGVEPTLKKIVGMFAFAVWNRELKQLILARDRFGEKPLYYGFISDRFTFSSDLSAVRKVFGSELVIDNNAVGEFIHFNVIPSPLSIYKGIKKLEPGSYLVYKDNNIVSENTYWCPIDVSYTAKETSLDFDNCVDDLESKLITTLQDQVAADVPVGCFLSGGIDSSTIAALMQSITNKPINTFSLGTDDESLNEAHFAKQIANHLGTNHTELYVSSKDLIDSVPKMADAYNEPFADSSQIPTYLVSQLAKNQVSVCLSGDGGDEIFGGYHRHIYSAKIDRSMPKSVKNILSILLKVVPVHLIRLLNNLKIGNIKSVGEALEGVKYVLADSPVSLLEYYEHSLSTCKTPNKLTNYSYNIYDGRKKLQFLKNNLDLAPNESLLMLLDVLIYLQDDILVKVDRAAMACSLETRIPFLDHRIYEFSASLPIDFKIQRSCTKRILREVLYRHVPKSMLERPKMGFGIPIATWLRKDLKEWAYQLITTASYNHDFFSKKAILQLWKEHQLGKLDRSRTLWAIIMFENWYQQQSKMGRS